MEISRIGDVCSGHDDCPPRPIITGSENVLINSIETARVGDTLDFHCDHSGTISSSSNNVFVNGMEVAFISSEVDCGSFIKTGSDSVSAS